MAKRRKSRRNLYAERESKGKLVRHHLLARARMRRVTEEFIGTQPNRTVAIGRSYIHSDSMPHEQGDFVHFIREAIIAELSAPRGWEPFGGVGDGWIRDDGRVRVVEVAWRKWGVEKYDGRSKSWVGVKPPKNKRPSRFSNTKKAFELAKTVRKRKIIHGR